MPPVMTGAVVGVGVGPSTAVLAGRRTASVLGVLAAGVLAGLAGLAGLAALMSASL
jgi:hypothetical protein